MDNPSLPHSELDRAVAFLLQAKAEFEDDDYAELLDHLLARPVNGAGLLHAVVPLFRDGYYSFLLSFFAEFLPDDGETINQPQFTDLWKSARDKVSKPTKSAAKTLRALNQ